MRVIVDRILDENEESTKSVDKNGKVEWRDSQGRYHREGGPAIIKLNGHKSWYRHGLLHREDGPADILPDGQKQWHINGDLHRLDGPAIETPKDGPGYFVRGRRLTQDEFYRYVDPTNGEAFIPPGRSLESDSEDEYEH